MTRHASAVLCTILLSAMGLLAPSGTRAAARPQAVAIAPVPTAEPVPPPPDRNVFWPPGYDPAAVAASNALAAAEAAAAAAAQAAQPGLAAAVRPALVPLPEDWDGARKQVKIGGISRLGDGRSAASINGVVRQKGDTVRIVFAGREYRWLVQAIDDRGVDLARAPEKESPTPPEAAPPAGSSPANPENK